MLYVNSIFEASCHCYYYRRSFNFVLCKIYFSNYIAYGYFFSIAHFGCFRLHAWPDMRIQVRPCKVMFLLISDVFSIMSSNIYYGKIIFDNFRVLLRVKNDQKLRVPTNGLTANFDAVQSILTLQCINFYHTVDKCTRKTNFCLSIFKKNWNNFLLSSQVCPEIFETLRYGDYFCT